MPRMIPAIGVLVALFLGLLGRTGSPADRPVVTSSSESLLYSLQSPLHTGTLYNSTFNGDADVGGYGAVYKLARVGNDYKIVVIYRFHGPDGAYPAVGLISDSAGALYGTTGGGGANGNGTVFKLTPTENGYNESILYSFKGGIDGFGPQGSLLEDRSGALFGTTQAGGDQHGTVFKLTPSTNGNGYREPVLYRFKGNPDGADPTSGLIADSTGALYGTTPLGGIPGSAGIVYKLMPNRTGYTEAVIYTFQGFPDGAGPLASLLADSTGALYGTTDGGGVGAGTVFKLTPHGNHYSESILYTFQGGADGRLPEGSLIADASGSLYSTTFGGGTDSKGTVFKLTPTGGGYDESVLHSFKGREDGRHPERGLTFDSFGSLYGTTDGASPRRQSDLPLGTVFSLTPNGDSYIYRVIHHFDRASQGANPVASVIVDSAGSLYGTTARGGM